MENQNDIINKLQTQVKELKRQIKELDDKMDHAQEPIQRPAGMVNQPIISIPVSEPEDKALIITELKNKIKILEKCLEDRLNPNA